MSGQRPGEFHWQQPITAQHLVDCRTFCWRWLKDSFDEPLTGPRNPGRNGEASVNDAAPQLSHGLSSEWHGAGNHEKEQNTHGPYVHWRTQVTLVPEELRRSVRGRTAERVQGVAAAGDSSAESKVSNFDTAAAAEQNILSLQVPMDDAAVVLQKAAADMSERGTNTVLMYCTCAIIGLRWYRGTTGDRLSVLYLVITYVVLYIVLSALSVRKILYLYFEYPGCTL